MIRAFQTIIQRQRKKGDDHPFFVEGTSGWHSTASHDIAVAYRMVDTVEMTLRNALASTAKHALAKMKLGRPNSFWGRPTPQGNSL